MKEHANSAVFSRCGGKAAAGAVALFLVFAAGLSFFTVLGFLFIALWMYLSEKTEKKNFRFSFWLAQIVFLLIVAEVPPGLLVVIPLLTYAGIVFIIFGLMNSLFSMRSFTYALHSTVLTLSFFVALFLRRPPFSGVPLWSELFWIVFSFAVVYFLFREFSRVFGLPESRKTRIAGFALGLASAEVGFLARYLPLGFVNAAALVTLLFLISRDMVLAKENGLLNLNFVFREMTIFIVISSLILVTVSWKL